MTSKNKRAKMKRETADKLLKAVQKRILEVNANLMFCYRVTEALVFGSYVNEPERQMLSDLDIALRLEPKYPMDSPEFQARRNAAPGGDFLLYLCWPQEEVYRYIRKRHPYISIHKLGVFKEEDEIILSNQTMQLMVEKEEAETGGVQPLSENSSKHFDDAGCENSGTAVQLVFKGLTESENGEVEE